MSPRSEAAAAARRVAAARRQLADPPPLDAAAWDALLRRIDELTRAGDRDSATAAVEAWERSALGEVTK